jgi:hypothetical protein
MGRSPGFAPLQDLVDANRGAAKLREHMVKPGAASFAIRGH